jgi:carboxypeptidase family protein
VYIFARLGSQNGNSAFMAFPRPACYGCCVARSNPLLPRVCTLNFLLKRYQPVSASRSLGRACLVLLLALVGVATAAAQTLKTSGTLEGTISDATAGRIPVVKVSLRQIETNQTRTVTADDQGFFRATDLPVGTYEVRIENPGFAPYLHTGVLLDVGTTVHLMSSFQRPASQPK